MITLILGALLFGCVLPALVGWIGSKRQIGFGWSFIISLIFTPLVGLIFVLISDPLPANSEPKLGCIGGLLSLVGILLLGFILFMALALLLFPL